MKTPETRIQRKTYTDTWISAHFQTQKQMHLLFVLTLAPKSYCAVIVNGGENLNDTRWKENICNEKCVTVLKIWSELQPGVFMLLPVAMGFDGLICKPGAMNSTTFRPLTLSRRRVINVKIPLQPHKKYDITQYGELDFS